MEVDGTATDRASSQFRNECFAELVEKRPAEQDRNARSSRKSVDIRARSHANIRGIHAQFAALLVVVNLDPVQGQEVRHHVNITNQRDVVELRGCVGQQRCNHRFGNKVLCSAHGNGALKRVATFNSQNRGHLAGLLAVDFL